MYGSRKVLKKMRRRPVLLLKKMRRPPVILLKKMKRRPVLLLKNMSVKKMGSWKTTQHIRPVAVGVAWMPLRAPNIVATQTDKSLQAATPSSNTWKEAFPEAVAYALGATQKWRIVIAAVGANKSLQIVRIPVYIWARRCYRTASPTT